MADYIKREDIINWIDDSLELCGDRYSVDQENMMELFRTVINDCIPFADVVERKRGKWVLVEDFSTEEIEDGEKYWVCSLCGCGSDSYDTTYHTNYCPNCGADMRGVTDEES